MARLVDADALIKAIENIATEISFNPPINKVIVKGVEFAKSTDRPSGKWQQVEVIDDDETSGINTDASKCSVCGAIQQSHYWATHYYSYCPNCGARMVGDKDDKNSSA